MMTIMLNNCGYDNDTWQSEIERQLPGVLVQRYQDVLDRSSIEYALVWNHPQGDLITYPNLRAIFSLGAGVEHLVGDETLPDVPVVMLADPAVKNDMAIHALHWVSAFHRQYPTYQSQQKNRKWERHNIKLTADYKVGVLGLGRIGRHVATTISSVGYNVSGWDQNQINVEGVSTYYGDTQLGEFLQETDVIINCLPNTPMTENFINAELLQTVPKGTSIINISRGSVIDDDALLSSLNSGQISNAALDAFDIEPLPEDHAYWRHPNVYVTPHMSGATYAKSAARLIVDNINRIENDELPFPLFDRKRGY